MGSGISKEDADKYYQAKGNYITNDMVKDHLTKQIADTYYQSKGDFITRTIADSLYQPKTNVMAGDMTSQAVTTTVQATSPPSEHFRYRRLGDAFYYTV